MCCVVLTFPYAVVMGLWAFVIALNGRAAHRSAIMIVALALPVSASVFEFAIPILQTKLQGPRYIYDDLALLVGVAYFVSSIITVGWAYRAHIAADVVQARGFPVVLVKPSVPRESDEG